MIDAYYDPQNKKLTVISNFCLCITHPTMHLSVVFFILLPDSCKYIFFENVYLIIPTFEIHDCANRLQVIAPIILVPI